MVNVLFTEVPIRPDSPIYTHLINYVLMNYDSYDLSCKHICVSAVSCLSPFHARSLALSPLTHTKHKQTHLHYLSHTPAHNPVNTPSCPAPSPSNLVSLC